MNHYGKKVTTFLGCKYNYFQVGVKTNFLKIVFYIQNTTNWVFCCMFFVTVMLLYHHAKCQELIHAAIGNSEITRSWCYPGITLLNNFNWLTSLNHNFFVEICRREAAFQNLALTIGAPRAVIVKHLRGSLRLHSFFAPHTIFFKISVFPMTNSAR